MTYVGPVPGHDLVTLDGVLRKALEEEDSPIIVHVRTRKGYGYRPAETDKVGFHGAALPPMPDQAPAASSTNGASPPRWRRQPHGRRAQAAEGAQLHRGDVGRAGPHRHRGRARRGHHRGHAHRHRRGRLRRPLPRPHLRRRHRGAARHDHGGGPRARRAAALRRALLDVPAARLRPGRARRLPERRVGGHRHRPCRTRGRGRHQPPGHVHAFRAPTATQPRARGTA